MRVREAISVWSRHPVGRMTFGRLGVAFGLFNVLIITFVYIARKVENGDTLVRDNEILLRINDSASASLDRLIVMLTSLGDMLSIATLTIALLLIFAHRKRWVAFVQVAAVIAGAGLLNITLKLLFARERPALWEQLIFESSYSFPSGHAMMTSALVFVLVSLTWYSRYRWPVFMLGLTYMIGIGFSRLYLGVHYPTDIIAGWCVSLAWVILVATILGILRPRHLVK